ncbi:hypothetical protein [Streptomyces sp. SGAir0957]
MAAHRPPDVPPSRSRIYELEERIARAVLDVPGVASLRPGLAQLLKASAGARTGTGTPAYSRAGIRIGQRVSTRPTRVEVYVVARGRWRAVDVARAVRRAVEDIVSDAQVSVTVTGVASTSG